MFKLISHWITQTVVWFYEIKLNRPVHGIVFGYPAYQDVHGDKQWKWSDTNDPLKMPIDRECRRCGKRVSVLGHDPCIENLPDVKYACCGHGVVPGYITCSSGKVKHFLTTKSLLKKVKVEQSKSH